MQRICLAVMATILLVGGCGGDMDMVLPVLAGAWDLYMNDQYSGTITFGSDGLPYALDMQNFSAPMITDGQTHVSPTGSAYSCQPTAEILGDNLTWRITVTESNFAAWYVEFSGTAMANGRYKGEMATVMQTAGGDDGMSTVATVVMVPR